MFQHCNSSGRVLTSAGFDKFYIYIYHTYMLFLDWPLEKIYKEMFKNFIDKLKWNSKKNV